MQLEIILLVCLLVTISLCGPCVQNLCALLTIQEESTITVKKMKVDLATKKSSQLQSGFIQVQAMARNLLAVFRVPLLFQCKIKFLANNKLG